MKKSLSLLVSICSLCLLSGCASGGSTPPAQPLVATHFSVTPATSSPTAGTSFDVMIAALDATNRAVPTYTGTVHFGSSDAQAGLPPSIALASGTGTASVTLKTAGPQTITATDANSLSGTSSPIPVGPGAAVRFSIKSPTAVSAGLQFTFTVAAFDAYNNVATTYSGIIHFSTNDSQAALPSDSALTNGTGTFPVTLKTVTSVTITVTDTLMASLTAGSTPISVVSNTATHFGFASPGSAATRAKINVTVQALDAANNVSAGYSGTVHFSSTDSQARLPVDFSLTAGTGSFSATFETAGSQTITATDTVANSVSGATSSITVSLTATPAISSGAPPAGSFGSTYGPVTTEDLRCALIAGVLTCTPCSGSAGCTSLPACLYRRQTYPCHETRHLYLGFPLLVAGGIAPYSWNISGLPPGLALTMTSGNRYISGVPTTPGSYNVSATVTDSGTPPATSPAGNYTIAINNPAPPVILTAPEPGSGAVNLPYTFSFRATSNAPPLIWRTSPGSGPLSPGLSLGPGGVLSGTPTTIGTYPITLIAEDSFKQDSAPQNFTIQIFAHGFEATGGMATSRVEFTATLLSTGKVLVAGGIDSSNTATASAELYDPATGTFSQTGSMGSPRAYFAATSLCNLSAPPCKDIRVLVTGGSDANGVVLMTAELYDPTSGTFSPTKGNMQYVHSSHTATLLNNGKVLIAGWGNAFAELFDPSTETFTATGSMATARVSHTATLLNSGKVLITGGIQGVPPNTKVLSEAELYDPATGSFLPTLNSMTTARQWHTATLLPDGNVLVAGGADGNGVPFATAEIFDPAAQSFTLTKGGMTAARGLQTATLLHDGTVLLTGGTSGTGSLASAELYDPLAGLFSQTGSMAAVRQQHTATLLNDGTVLVTGGPSATAELYK